MNIRRWPVRLVPLLMLAGAGAKEPPDDAVYVTRGEHGEVVFTDVDVPGAERVNVAPPAPPGNAAAELERRIEQMLTVAQALEQSRLAREQARAEAREAAARQSAAPLRADPPVIYQDHYAGYPYLFRHPHHRFPHRRRFPRGPDNGGDDDEPAPEIVKKFPYEPD